MVAKVLYGRDPVAIAASKLAYRDRKTATCFVAQLARRCAASQQQEAYNCPGIKHDHRF